MLKYLKGIIPDSLHQWVTGSNEVNILVTGKTGTGKSSLINGIIGEEVAPEGSTLNPETSEVTGYPFKLHEVDVTVWDSPGLQDGTGKEKEYIQDMQRKGCASADLVVYCIRMCETRFPRKEDKEAVKKLSIGLGKTIWKNAVLVLTFANQITFTPNRGEAAPTPKQKQELFKARMASFKEKLRDTLVEAGVDKSVADAIPVVPAGYEEPVLMDRDNWLGPLWYTCILRMKPRSQPALLKANLDRIKLPDQIKPEDFDKPVREQPIVYMPIPVKYGAPPAICTVIGAVIGVAAGPAGAAAGAAAGAVVGAAADGLLAFFSSGGKEDSGKVEQPDKGSS